MSLLLDALKKAAEEKQRMSTDEPTPARPRSQPAENNGQSGTQLLSLLQGKDQEDELDNVDGFEPFDEDDTGKSGFSLSLIDEGDESLDQLGFKEQPEPALTETETETETAPAANPLASFTLELLDDDEVLPDVAAAPPRQAPVTTSLTLLDDEPASIAPAAPQPQAAPESPVASVIEASEVHATVQEAVVNEPEETVVDEPVSEQAPATPEAMQTPAVEAGAVIAETPQTTVPEVESQVAPPPAAPIPEHIAPVKSEPSSRPGNSAPVFDTAPEMVLNALQRRRRRRRVLILSLLLSIGLTAGGWGYLVYEEQLKQNNQMLARYKQPSSMRPSTPAALQTQTMAESAAVITPEQARSTVNTTTELRTGTAVVAPESTTATAAAVTPAASVAKAVETALEVDRGASKNGSVTLQGEGGSGVLKSAGTDAYAGLAEDSGRVTIKHTVVDKGILESESRMGIARRHTEARVLSAYRAFQDGDMRTALKLYQQALAEDPFSRDAVMGLAAIAATERDFGKAAYYYKQLLDYDPTDESAFEGLIGLPDTGLDLVDMESRLRNYLASNPDSARAQARLGRTMARQKRWHEAQQAFFNAHRLNPAHASYALNVAIALDHLRKYSVARRYYEQALTLGAQSGKENRINMTSVRQRLDALSQLGN